MLNLPSKKQIEKSQQETLWGHGNNILYNLCKNNYEHKKDDVIITKVLFIGRIYAAALERNSVNKNIDNTTFYFNTIPSTFGKSELDDRLSNLKAIGELTKDNIPSVLETHKYLMDTIKPITDLNSRSFCSKYLHFHLPNLFFIYDSIALRNMGTYISRIPNAQYKIIRDNEFDNEYAKFFCKCFVLRNEIKTQYEIELTTRQLDNLLLEAD